MPRSDRHHRAGFTLMEIILVLVVIAICAMVAGPKLANFSRGRLLPNAALDLATTARWCRVQALNDGVQYRLNLDADGGSYWVTRDDGSGQNFTEIASDVGKKVELPEGVVMSCPDIPIQEEGVYLTFSPGGQKDVGTITLMSDARTLNIMCETPSAPYRVFDPSTLKVMR